LRVASMAAAVGYYPWIYFSDVRPRAMARRADFADDSVNNWRPRCHGEAAGAMTAFAADHPAAFEEK